MRATITSLCLATVVSADTPYRREDWLPRWSVTACKSTRDLVLARHSIVSVEWSPDGCRVVRGLWTDPYRREMPGASATVGRDPSQWDIDHTVPLVEAHRSGGSGWPESEKRAFAEAIRFRFALIPVTRQTNLNKGDADLCAWQPPVLEARCDYALWYAAITSVWGLGWSTAERGCLATALETC